MTMTMTNMHGINRELGNSYSYETFPGQTILRTAITGYTISEVIDEIRLSGEGRLVSEPDRTDSNIDYLVENYGIIALWR